VWPRAIKNLCRMRILAKWPIDIIHVGAWNRCRSHSGRERSGYHGRRPRNRSQGMQSYGTLRPLPAGAGLETITAVCNEGASAVS
jgi:hypothetical protein